MFLIGLMRPLKLRMTVETNWLLVREVLSNPDHGVSCVFHPQFSGRNPEAILAIFGRSFLFYLLKGLEKRWKMTPLLCACAVVITSETQKSQKIHLASSNLAFLRITMDENGFRRMKEKRAVLHKVASKFSVFAWGLSYDLSKFGNDFTPFFRISKTITKSLAKHYKVWGRDLSPEACWTSVQNLMKIIQAVKKLNSISRERLNFWRQPILCITLYRNPIQASNFDGAIDQLFLWIFMQF